MIPTGSQTERPAVSDGEIKVQFFREIVIEHRADRLVDVIRLQYVVLLLRRGGVVIGLGQQRNSDTGTNTEFEMGALVERDVCERIWCNRMTHQVLASALGAVDLPITERHTHTGVVPFPQTLPIRGKTDGEIGTRRRSDPFSLVPCGSIDLAIRHDHTSTHRETVVDIRC